MDDRATRRSRAGLSRMMPRDPAEPFRSASALELFFDLIFVVAVSFSSAQLHHIESEGHLAAGTGAYFMVFFGIWWAWMNFTWFASAFDPDDWLHRLFTIAQMGGVIVLAVGTGPAMTQGDFGLMIGGYAIMRFALVAGWLRAGSGHPDYRRTAHRYALGITVLQLAWFALLLVPAGFRTAMFCVLVIGELAVPIWAETARQTPWHPEHIADRYGCFTMIVLGESVLASTVAVADGLQQSAHPAQVLAIGVSGFVLAAGMWWLYFAAEATERLSQLRTALQFGYGHYFVFAAGGAFSAGVSVLVGVETGESELPRTLAQATLTGPVAVFVFGAWLLVLRFRLRGAARLLVPVGAVLIAASALLPWAIVVAAGIVAALVALIEASGVRRFDSTEVGPEAEPG